MVTQRCDVHADPVSHRTGNRPFAGGSPSGYTCVAEGDECLVERNAEVGQRRFHLGRHLPVDLAVYELIGLQLAQLLDEHLLAHPGQPSTQLGEASGPRVQLPRDQGLPLSADRVDCRVQAATVRPASCRFTYLSVSTAP